jgi:hypothetical protein
VRVFADDRVELLERLDVTGGPEVPSRPTGTTTLDTMAATMPDTITRDEYGRLPRQRRRLRQRRRRVYMRTDP